MEGTAFCAGCGRPVGASNHPVAVAPLASAGTQGSVQPAVANAQPVSSGLTSNVAAALAYVLGFITGIVFLVLEPYKRDRFVRFHAMQSILYSAASLVFRIGWGILVNILMSFTVWAGVVLVPIGLLISLGLFAFWLYLMYQAYNNREYRIPFIGAIAAKQVG